MFCPELVVSRLAEEFGPCKETRAPTRMEQKFIDHMAAILREATYGFLDVESDESEVMDDSDTDSSWSAEDTDEEDVENKGPVRFGEVDVSEEVVKSAIEYYRSTEKGSRPLSSMKSRFRFITNEYHLKKLREIEKKQVIRADRISSLRALASKLKNAVASKFQMGIALHDSDIRQIALKLNMDEVGIPNFKASHRWLQEFKKRNGIVSRRVTTFTSKRNFLNHDRLSSDAELFVSAVRKEMENWRMVCNVDQSGFFKELHSTRTLATKGLKKVTRVVQSVAATTHSFTIMPMLYVDGHLGEKLFIVMQEAQGKFPDRGHFQARNLEVRAHTSHIMNKPLLLEWVQSCLASADSTSILLLVDSWSSFKDHNAMLSLVPDNKMVKIMNIPPGTTSSIQPLDVYFFRPFKAMYKRFTSYIIAHDLDFVVHSRDSILRLLSLIYFQFCAPRFRNFLVYPWYAAGYLDAHPDQFETPVQYCFARDLLGQCERENCNEMFFIRCAHCQHLLCFSHFVIEHHICA